MTLPSFLYRGESYLAVDKPPGQLVIPGREGRTGSSLHERLEASLGKKLWVVHRIDRDTSGVLLFALDATAHRALSRAFEAGQIEKRYLALVRGLWGEERLVEKALLPARRGRMRVAGQGEVGKAAATRVRTVEAFAEASLVEALPLTGRTHQIRVHLADSGHPLLVDHQYGEPGPLLAREVGGVGDEVVLARTPLHAASLRLPPIGDDDARELQAPLSHDMAQAIELLRGTCAATH